MRSNQEAFPDYIRATYSDAAVRDTLKKIVMVFEAKNAEKILRFCNDPLEEVAELVMKHKIDWEQVDEMLIASIKEDMRAQSTDNSAYSDRGRSRAEGSDRGKEPDDQRSRSRRGRAVRNPEPAVSDSSSEVADYDADDDQKALLMIVNIDV